MCSSSSLVSAGFPESFSRSTSEYAEPQYPDTSSESTPGSDDLDHDESTLTFRRLSVTIPEKRASPEPHLRRQSRSSVMRLENILNDVSINHAPNLLNPRSRSLGRSPLQSQSELESISPISPVFTNRRSVTPEDSVKKKKVKMHKCPECHKEFPRPSGLRTHMNTHTKEKPFPCTYPGCNRTFSVVSNAKRHMRTHGLGVSPEEADTSSIPYVVGFEEPVVAGLPDRVLVNGDGGTGNRQPFRLRWIPLSEEAGLPEMSRSAPEGNRGRVPDLSGTHMRGRSVDEG